MGVTPSIWAFSLGGPIGNGGDSWQTAVIGYNLPGDLNAPKNIGEGYRYNNPTLYYAYDANFVDYFSTNGEAAIQAAFATLNSAFTNNPTGATNGLDGYSTGLTEFPLDSTHFNFQAQALGIVDLKSSTMLIMMEQLGLTDPIRYDWTLHNRYLPPNATCPSGEEYLVVQRNFDTGGYPIPGSSSVNSLYSPYVDGTLYSYTIFEDCGIGGLPYDAITEPVLVDPAAGANAPLAALDFTSAFQFGAYYTGLTRDDAMGLRYLLSTNLINEESVAPGGSIILSTTNFNTEAFFPNNPASPFVAVANGVSANYGTFDLGTLILTSQTTDPATLETLFPGLVVASSTSQYLPVVSETTVSYYTNFPGSQAGSPPTLVVTGVLTTNYTLIYSDTFANVITNSYSPSTTYTVQDITVQPRLGAPAGSPPQTNITYQTFVDTNLPSGDYYLLPTNQCGFDIVGAFHTNVYNVTNFTTSAAATNNAGTNGQVYSFTQNIVFTLTNVVYLTHPVTCTQTTGATNLYQGIEKINFVYSSYDSLVGQYFQPITNIYTMRAVINSQVQPQTITRVVTAPDVLFSATDLDDNGGIGIFQFYRTLDFDQANVLNGLAGPGTITLPTKITFNKSVPVYFNSGTSGLVGDPAFTDTPGGSSSSLFDEYFVWGSFDGSTNPPVVYPNTTSINQIENQILILLTPTTLPNGTNGVAYSSQFFSASGGSFTPPYTWSGSGFPVGLSVSSTGFLTGTPTQSGSNFVATVTLTDSLSRTVQWSYPLTILPSTP